MSSVIPGKFRVIVPAMAVAAFVTWPLLSGSANAEDGSVYLTDVKPVLHERCFACHGALKQEGGLRLDTGEFMVTGGDSGAAIVPGNIDASLLLERISAAEEYERMPPEGSPLTAEQIAAFRRWVEGGASYPKDESPEPDPRRHWAFQPPVAASPPLDAQGQALRNPIDAFLSQKREQRGLIALPPADKRTLLRRVHLDLTGLPPTMAELQEFVTDDAPDAYEKVVDRLLNSPAYGERWGRHWMDIWRYSDWYGLGAQVRNSQKHIWRWRDWIVESLNDDKGYDRMVSEMLAGDELAPTDYDTLRATGFLARNYYLFNRTTWLDSTIEHTSKAFLGLTMNCAKCHDHKYDPLSQRDYYAFRAFFEPHQVRMDAVPGEVDLDRDGLPRVFDAHPDAMTYLHIRGDEKNPDESAPLPPAVPAVLQFTGVDISPVALPAPAYRPSLHPFVLQNHLTAAEAELRAAEAELAKAGKALESARRLAAASEPQPADGNPEADTFFVQDDFNAPNPDVWESGPGQWEYVDGKLVQSQTGATRKFIRSRHDHPENFQATIQFRTTGGDRWKSVGLAFDVADDDEKFVYLSAVQPGSKLQASYKTAGMQVYPADGKHDLPVELNRTYELTVSVVGSLANVALDGRHLLAYQYPTPRAAGRLDIVAFDAAVEFDRAEIRTLPSETSLHPVGAKPISVEQAAHCLAVAETKIRIGQLRADAARAIFAADTARHRSPPADDADSLIHAAAVASRKLEHAVAELAVLTAQGKLAAADEKTREAVEKEIATAEEKAAQAALAIAEPGDAYTSLSASLKAAEGPAESDASRRTPYPPTSTGRRTALAGWVVHRDNPLTARVAVNHIWLRHFGTPLVDPVTDFGRRTHAPVHQDLLDWLAVDFMEGGWHMRRLHRLIVTSDAYRLSGATVTADEATKAADPTNIYYWRRDPVRMESQVIRDSLLHLAGSLDPTLGGPPVAPAAGTDSERRSLYFTHSRDGREKFLASFDDADIFVCYRREESVVPQQALAMANSAVSLKMAGRIAARVQADLGDAATDDQFIDAAFRLILASVPDEQERTACREALAATEELLAESDDRKTRARANLVHALLNHNDFLTIR